LYTKFHQHYALLNNSQNIKISNQFVKFVNINYDVTYNFNFVSLVAPHLTPNLRLCSTEALLKTTKTPKALFKKSYLIYT
jgi:hypothetical protein